LRHLAGGLRQNLTARRSVFWARTLLLNQIAQLLPEANILLDVEATSKKRLFEQIGQLFEDQAQIARSVVFDSLFAREKLGSTGLGQGIAIPHGRIRGLAHPLGAFVRPRQPIPFDAPDGKPVGQIFVLLVPEHATEEHLQLLSELAEMFSERVFRDQLTVASDPASLHRLFCAWESAA
jgi:PTS system nitrogen regulatory IIA component